MEILKNNTSGFLIKESGTMLGINFNDDETISTVFCSELNATMRTAAGYKFDSIDDVKSLLLSHQDEKIKRVNKAKEDIILLCDSISDFR
jgi:hypothetical protein